jgi:ArsR family transcriptional regulator, arsenate/arsenite/antimonite-responsive transcriptional repressor
VRDFFRALSDVTRLRIVQRLAAAPATVTALAAHVDLSQPLVSWHLRALRTAGLVETRRSGREVICSLRDATFEEYGRHLRVLLDGAAPGELDAVPEVVAGSAIASGPAAGAVVVGAGGTS